jgi:hypothetical protein
MHVTRDDEICARTTEYQREVYVTSFLYFAIEGVTNLCRDMVRLWAEQSTVYPLCHTSTRIYQYMTSFPSKSIIFQTKYMITNQWREFQTNLIVS